MEKGDAVAEPERIDPGERTADEEIAEAEERDRDRCESKTSSATVCRIPSYQYVKNTQEVVNLIYLSNFTSFQFHTK